MVIARGLANECRAVGPYSIGRSWLTREMSVLSKVHRGLRNAALDLENVQVLDLSGSPDLVCKNMMCEKLGEVCVCKLAMWASQSKPRLLQLKRLDLSNNGLNILPDSIFDLDSLKSLNLSYNDLKELPDEICRLHQMETLDVRGNPKLETLPPSLTDRTKLGNLRLQKIIIDKGMAKLEHHAGTQQWSPCALGDDLDTVVLERML